MRGNGLLLVLGHGALVMDISMVLDVTQLTPASQLMKKLCMEFPPSGVFYATVTSFHWTLLSGMGVTSEITHLRLLSVMPLPK